MKGLSIPYKKLGAWTDGWSVDTVYQAATDGVVTAYSNVLNTQVSGFTDANTPPTAERAAGHNQENNEKDGFTMPVKKNDYWKVVGSTTIFWIPYK